jgi:flagellar assembly protein FliH
MQSSFNVIKNSRIIEQGSREINTQGSEMHKVVNKDENYDENHDIKDSKLESYESIAKNILGNAKRQSEEIISKAYIESVELKAQVLETATQQGYKDGYNEGYEIAYNKAMGIAMDEAKLLKAEADSTLMLAKKQYNSYLIEKEQHIKALIINIAESILKREVKEPDALNEMIFHTLEAERNIKTYIIKVNNCHFAMIKDQIETFKVKLAFQGDIFVIEDNLLDEGTAVIEKETGKSIVSIAYGIEKIVEVFQEEQI